MEHLELTETVTLYKKFIRLVGPTTAVYFDELVSMYKAKVQSGEIDQITGEFVLDRSVITENTGILKPQQVECDKTLTKLEILTITGSKARVDLARYFGILTEQEKLPANFISNSAKLTKEEAKAVKMNKIRSGILELFAETDPELVAAYSSLIDVFYQKGFYKEDSWKPIVELINKTATTKDAKLNLCKFAISSGWRNWNLITETFKRQYIPEVPTARQSKINNEIKF